MMNSFSFTADWFQETLGATEYFSGYIPENISHSIIGRDLGLMSTMFRLVFHPSPPSGPSSVIVKRSNNWEDAIREVGFYRELAHSIQTRIPCCYYTSLNLESRESVVILEDLSAGVPGDFAIGCNTQQTDALIDALKGIHISFWNDTKLGKLPWLGSWRDETHKYEAALKTQIPIFLQRHSSIIEEDAYALVEQLPIHFASAIQKLESLEETLLHFDFHMENLIFLDQQPVVLDWQTICRGPAILDVARMLIECFPVDQQLQLLSQYQKSLCAHAIVAIEKSCSRDALRAALTVIWANIVSSEFVNRSPDALSQRQKDGIATGIRNVQAALLQLEVL